MYEAGRKIRGEPVTIAGPVRPVFDAGAVVRYLRRGWGIMLLCGLLSTAASLGLLAWVSPYYTSILEILVDPTALHIVPDDIVSRRPQNDSGVSQAETQGRVIRSDSVLRRVVRTLDLASDPDFVRAGWLDGLQDLLARYAGIAIADRSDPAEAALDTLRRIVSVRRPERTMIINVYVETRDSAKSARVANAIAAAFVEEESANKTGVVKRLTGTLGGGIDGLKAAVADVEGRIGRYRRENGLVSTAGTPLSDFRVTALNQQLVNAEIRTADARARLDQARRARPEDAGSALPEMLRSPELRDLRQQDSTVSRNKAELAARLGERHPGLQEQAAQERDLKRSIQREKERIVDSLQKEADRAAASEAAIRSDLKAAKSEATDNDRAEVGLRELNRELAARRSVYEAYLRRSREIGAQEQIDSTRIRVISPAAPAFAPSWPPPRKLILIQAFAFGSLVGAVIALLRGTRRDRRRFEAATGLMPDNRAAAFGP